MRREALNLLICPNCGGQLALGSDAPPAESDDQIMSGELTCTTCASRFGIRDGVPVLLPANLASVKLETASRFAEEWTRWSDQRDYYDKEFFDWIGPRASSEDPGPPLKS